MWNKCTLCGECLMKCPVMKMDKNEAVFVINNIFFRIFSINKKFIILEKKTRIY
ncbi:MAG: 4Fe-4S binding protein [Promethearchaeota archaeon]